MNMTEEEVLNISKNPYVLDFLKTIGIAVVAIGIFAAVVAATTNYQSLSGIKNVLPAAACILVCILLIKICSGFVKCFRFAKTKRYIQKQNARDESNL